MRQPPRFAHPLIALALLLNVVVATAQDVYRDDFPGAPQLPWTDLRGNWAVNGGEYFAQNPGNAPLTATLLPYELSDFSFSVDLVAPTDGGLWLRTDAAAQAGVVLVVKPGSIYWHVISDPISGPYTVYGQAPIVPPLGAGATRVRVTGNGPLLRAYLDDSATPITTLDLTQVTSPPGSGYLSGRVGLYDFASPGTRFARVHLERGSPYPVLAVGEVLLDRVQLFHADASGNAAPLAVLAGANTLITRTYGVDLDDDALFVASEAGQFVRSYPRHPLGNAAPATTIAGPSTLLGDAYHLHQSGGELYVGSSSGPLSVFGRGDDGNVAPRRTITGLTAVFDAVPSEGELFVTRTPTSGDAAAVAVYSSDAAGAAVPLRRLAGANTGLGIFAPAVAASHDLLFVAQYYENSIRVYPRGANGDVAPLRVIAGPNSGLSSPIDLAIRDGELYVANSGTASILVFPIAADGDVAPARVIAGPATGLGVPFALAMGIEVLPYAVFADGFE